MISFTKASSKALNKLSPRTVPSQVPGGVTVTFKSPLPGRVAFDRPLRPELIDAGHAARLICNPAWWLQEKFSGQHLLIHSGSAGPIGTDQGGSHVTMPASIAQASAGLPGAWIIEGVWDGEIFTAFDLPCFEGLDFRILAYRLRLAALRQMLRSGAPTLQIVETARETAAKAELFERLHREGREGVVLRRFSRASPTAGDVLACRFCAADGGPSQCPRS